MAQFSNGDFESATAFQGWTKTPYQNNKIPATDHAISPRSISDLGMGTPTDTADLTSIGSGSAGTVQDPLMNGYGASFRYPFSGTKTGVVNLDLTNKALARKSKSPDASTYTFHPSRATSIKQRVLITSEDVDPSDGKVHVRFALAPILDNPGLIARVAGTASVGNSSKNVTGVGTHFTSLVVGNDIYFGADTNGYSIASITSDTVLTLSGSTKQASSGAMVFAGAASGHFPEEQPYFAVEVRKITSTTDATPVAVSGAPVSSTGQLFFTFNFSNQPGTAWGNVTNTVDKHLYTYSNFQAFDIAPGNAKLKVGDTIELEVVAAGCSPGGHEGHVYVDNFSFLPPQSLWVSAVGPTSVSSVDGTTITYTYTYKNNGSTTVNNVIVAPTMPQDNSSTPLDTTFVSETGASCTASGGAAASTPTPGGALSCNVGTLAAGQSGSFTIVVKKPNGAVGPINNGNYQISGTSVNALTGPLVQTSLVAAATLSDMSVSSSLPTSATVGAPYTGSFACQNVGVAAATNPTCEANNLPAGVTVTGCALSPNATVWTNGTSVPVNETVTCQVSGTPTTPGTVTPTLSTGADNDSTPGNNSVSPSILVLASGGNTSDMSINLNGLPTTATNGSPYSGSYTCSNQSSVAATGGTTCDIAGLTGASISCTVPTSTPWVNGDAVAGGQTVTCSVSWTPASSGAVQVTGSTGALDDENTGNNTATRTVTVAAVVIPASDMAVNLAGLPTTAKIGNAYSGSFFCANIGSVDATNPSCSASNLPTGVTVTGCTLSPASSSWSNGTAIPVGQKVTCTVSGNPVTAGTVAVSVTTGASNDSTSANNTAAVNIVVISAQPQTKKTPPNTPVSADLTTSVNAPVGATFSKVTDPSHGTVVVNTNGTYTYTPAAGFIGTDTFTYEVCDGANCSTSTVTIAIDPSGIVYDSQTRQPINGATVTLSYNGAPVPASWLSTGSNTQNTGVTGYYGFFFTGLAESNFMYSLSVSAPGYGTSPSSSIPPSVAPGGYAGGSVGYVGAPPVGQTTTYYLSVPLPTIDIINNNIPLDSNAYLASLSDPAAVTAIPTLSEWGMILLSAIIALGALPSTRRRLNH